MVNLTLRTRIVRRYAALVGAVVVALALAGPSALAGPPGGGDFTVSSSSNPLYLVRGGLPECPEWNCDANHNWEPRAFDCGYGAGCFYSGTNVYVRSIDGSPLGKVDLEVLDLPAGVTSQTAGRVASNRGDMAYTPFVLAATTSAPLGDFVVTVREATTTSPGRASS